MNIENENNFWSFSFSANMKTVSFFVINVKMDGTQCCFFFDNLIITMGEGDLNFECLY